MLKLAFRQSLGLIKAWGAQLNKVNRMLALAKQNLLPKSGTEQGRFYLVTRHCRRLDL